MKTSISGFELRSGVEHPDSIVSNLSSEKRSARASKYTLFTWKDEGIWKHQKLGTAANGYEIGRLGRSKFGNRYYILPRTESIDSGREELSSEEHRLLSEVGMKMSNFTISLRLSGIEELLDELARTFGSEFRRLDDSAEFTILDKGSFIHLGSDEEVVDKPRQLWMPLRKSGLIRKPEKTFLHVYSEQFKTKHLEQISSRLRISLGELSPETQVKVIPFAEAETILESSKYPYVAYIGVFGSKGDPIPDKTKQHLKALDSARIPYRVFGPKTFNERYALNDQVPHLIELLGGKTFSTHPLEGFEDCVYLGFDLGHPKNIAHSVPVMTIVDASGSLLGYWRGTQPKDETLRSESMRDALQWLMEFKNNNLKANSWLVMRDGRSFKNDGINLILNELGSKLTYVEVIKNPVPLLHHNNIAAQPGTLSVVDGGQEAFLQTEAPLIRYQIGKPIRIKVKHNPMDRPIESIAEAVYSQCLAPSLGLRNTRIPSPIYWADGLAKESGQSLQFAGLHHVGHN